MAMLASKTAFITGASSGIGKAAAIALTRAGYRVIGTSRSTAPGEVRDGIRMIACDVTDDASVTRAVALAHGELGRIDLLVNNAGYAVSGAAEESSVEQVRALFDTNFLGVVRVTNAVLPIMRAQGGGRILTIASSSIKQPIPGLVLSNAFRTGVYGLVKTLARELGSANILLNVVAPGRIQTERIEELDNAMATRRGVDLQQVKKESVASIPLGRLGTPEEFANLLVFLASDAGRYISGQAIIVDGGATAAL